MVDFVSYQIASLKKRLDNDYMYAEKIIDLEFVFYCEKYISHYKKLSSDLYNHLNSLFWKYHED